MISIIRGQKKRKRSRDNKKWTSEEIRYILNYLQNSTDIEAPTAQIYYRKFISETGINATWDLIRWKVRHLKNTYKKAKDWRSTPEANSLECNEGMESVNARVLRICPQFYQLDNIFGEKMKTKISWHEIVESEEPIENASIKINVDDICEMSDIFKMNSNNETSATNYCNDTEDCHTNLRETPFANTSTYSTRNSLINNLKNNKIRDPKSLFSYLADFQAQKTALFKMRLEWEQQKHMEEMEVNRRKIALDEEKIKAEIELKNQELELKRREFEQKSALQEETLKAEISIKKREIELREREIERDERFKVLEIEKDERLKKYEIEMKLKYENNQNINF